MLLVPVYFILLFPLIVISFSPSVFLFRCVLHPLPLSSCLGCIPPLIGLPSLRFYAVGSSLFLLYVCFLFMFSILSRRCPLLATSLSVLLCRLSMLISDSRFDLVWFCLSCDHGWIRSGSVNVRKQQLTVKLSGFPDLSVASIRGPRVSRGVRAFEPHQCGRFRVHFPEGPSRVPSRQHSSSCPGTAPSCDVR